MSKLHIAWLGASFLLSLGMNHAFEPSFDYAALGEGGTLSSGELSASGVSRGTLKLVDLRVVSADVERPFGGPLPVRLVWLRGALENGQTEPDVELFADLTPESGEPSSPDARSMDAIKGRPLPVLDRAVASDLRSRVRFPGTDGPAFVTRGTLTINEALEVDRGAFRVRGELDIELEKDGEVTAVFARVSGKLVYK